MREQDVSDRLSELLGRPLAALRTRMDQLYEDKLGEKITEVFWAHKQTEYPEQERSIETSLSNLDSPITPERLLTVERNFDLAQRAHTLYLTRNHVADRQIPTVTLFCNEKIKRALPLRLGDFQRIGKAQCGEPREVTVSCNPAEDGGSPPPSGKRQIGESRGEAAWLRPHQVKE